MAFIPGLVAAVALSAGVSVAVYNSDPRDPNIGTTFAARTTTLPYQDISAHDLHRAHIGLQQVPADAHKACGRNKVGDWFYADAHTLKVICNGTHGQYERTVTK